MIVSYSQLSFDKCPRRMYVDKKLLEELQAMSNEAINKGVTIHEQLAQLDGTVDTAYIDTDGNVHINN